MGYRIPVLVWFAITLAACGSVNRTIHVADGEHVPGNLRTVNGALLVGREAVVDGNLNTVNGRIEVGSDSRVGAISTVNGSIRLGESAQAGSSETVNGSVELGANARIDGDVEAVNGDIRLKSGARVTGAVQAVNGRLELDGAEAGALENMNGGMHLDNGSVVHGELRVRRSRTRPRPDTTPTIVIGRNCRVVGPLVFERPVQLKVHESAEIGEVRGAEVEIFTD